jgi:hypothetical protein
VLTRSTPREQTVTVEPPEGADAAKANRVCDEIEGLLAAIHEEMRRDGDPD